MKGPGLRLIHDVRRTWRCPRCERIKKTPFEATSCRCGCQPNGSWMTLLDRALPIAPYPFTDQERECLICRPIQQGRSEFDSAEGGLTNGGDRADDRRPRGSDGRDGGRPPRPRDRGARPQDRKGAPLQPDVQRRPVEEVSREAPSTSIEEQSNVAEEPDRSVTSDVRSPDETFGEGLEG